jgi:prepilin-type N-terminal cleavage/methylation domain-containing protein
MGRAFQFFVATRRRGFSLIEVVAALGIFAIGMIAVLGLFAPVTKSVAGVSDAEAAARVADAVRARLRSMPFAAAAALVQDVTDVRKNDSDGTYNPNDGTRHPGVIFGRLNGEVGFYNGSAVVPAWYDYDYSSTPPRARPFVDADKFFEIDLIRDETISPKAGDPTASMIAFHVRVRWPAFVRTSPTTAVSGAQNPAGGAVPFDHGKKQVLFFAGAIAR